LKRSKSSTGVANKRFGQHFLEPVWVSKLVRAIDPQPSDVFLEIGPGRGALTGPLAAAGAPVVAVEIDRALAADLGGGVVPGVSIIEADFLELAASRLKDALDGAAGVQRSGPQRLRVAANLPYNVGSPILVKLVDLFRSGFAFTDATVMLQREVADRLLANPGTKEYGVLTIMIGRWARIERLFNLPPGAFRPAPKVQSSVLRLGFHHATDTVTDEERFRQFVQALFSRRRKTLKNALLAWNGIDSEQAGRILERAAVDGRRRPETLSLAELAGLASHVSPLSP
jgi:16S rRNA (adenine1518-N6/adenine1519-N6)-dimethyltransferase